MKNNEYMKTIGVSSAVLGIILYRIMKNYYGDKGPKIVIYICIALLVFIVVSLIFMKQFLVSLFILIITIPIVIIAIGMYLDNFLVLVSGIILFFILNFVVIKICKK